MNLLTANGLEIFKKIKNINKLNDNDISKLNFDIMNTKLFKQIKIDEEYINKINVIKSNIFYYYHEYLISKYNLTLSNKLCKESNLKNRCILLFMAYLDTRYKFYNMNINFSLLPTYKNEYSIFNGNCWMLSYIYSKHHEILYHPFKIYYLFKYYLEIILKYPNINNMIDLSDKIFKKGKRIKKLEDIKNKSGILIYSDIDFKNLHDKILNNARAHGVYIINNSVVDPNFDTPIIINWLIDKHKNEKKYYYFIED